MLNKVDLVNFKSKEISAFTLKEAQEKLAETVNMEVFANATIAWNKAGKPRPGTPEYKVFCSEFLTKKTKNKAGLAGVIVMESGSADTRQRPYSFENVVNKEKRKYQTFLTVIDDETGKVLVETNGTKTDAKEAVRDLYSKDGYRGNATCFYNKKVVKGTKEAFTVKYQPSKSAKEGVFMFFGIERND